jgi:hypothetical protein
MPQVEESCARDIIEQLRISGKLTLTDEKVARMEDMLRRQPSVFLGNPGIINEPDL